MGSFLPSDGVSPLFSALQVSRQSLSNAIMNQGTRLLQNRQFEEAIGAFRRAAAYSPGSIDALILLGRTHQFMGQSNEAIASFERALKVDPTSTRARGYLANAYVTANRFGEAEREFKRLLATDSANASTVASLGYVYLSTGKASEAEAQFRKAVQLAPQDAAAYYSLGLSLNAQQRYSDAVDQFQHAIAIKSNYALAHADLATAYIGLGDLDSAETQVDLLENLNTAQGYQLAGQVRLELLTPKISYVDISKSDFDPLGHANSPLTWLDPYLATPGASKVFKMVFQFNQAMDPDSIEDPHQWSIRKAKGGEGGVYANGVLLNIGQQIQILPIPISVEYDPITHQATVSFRITQNAAGNGLIDPSHWVFRFRGTDAAGNPMDPRGDEWDGSAFHSF